MSHPCRLQNANGEPVSADSPLPVITEAFTRWITLNVDISGAYTAGDVLADVFELKNVVRKPGDSILIHNVAALDEADQGAAMDILFFTAQPTVAALNAAWATTDALMRAYWRGIVRIVSGDWVDLGGNRVAEISTVGKMVTCATTSLWVATIAQGTPTFAAVTDLSLKIGFLR